MQLKDNRRTNSAITAEECKKIIKPYSSINECNKSVTVTNISSIHRPKETGSGHCS